MLKATKSTLKTIEKYGFDRAALDAEMADYGYTTKIEYGCVAVVDEKGISVDFGKPYLVHHEGEKFGTVIFSEFEIGTYCHGEYFDVDQIDY